ncbi:hypothetical protein [Fusobacterium polymorphum]|uniref:hypothetical protein n=1 Tax=Fusobacterium nucleatum subsp. polymorphum TaxID=76857 RepID=UPI0030089836
MKKNALNIEIKKINDEWSYWLIKHLNYHLLNEETNKEDKNINFVIGYNTKLKYIKNNYSEIPLLILDFKDDYKEPHLIKNTQLEDLIGIVNDINKKYNNF